MPKSLKSPKIETGKKYRRRAVPLEEKIQILERFSETGEKIVGNTIFEGYPIGQWGIQIRHSITKKHNINPTKEQMERLEKLGVLQRQIDSTIDEKIDSLVNWKKNYPKATLGFTVKSEILREYAETDEEHQQIIEEYEKMKKYYNYITYRKAQHKLKEEQVEKCKEGNVGGVFGYPTEIEELAKRYRKTEKEIDYILFNYGTIENFLKLYKNNELKNESDIELAGSIIKYAIDIDCVNNFRYENLIRKLIPTEDKKMGITLYSSELLKKSLNELTERERRVIERRYDLTEEGLPKNLEKVGEEIGITRERVRQIQKKAERRLRVMAKRNGFIYSLEDLKNNDLLGEDEKEKIAEIEKIVEDISISNNNLTSEEVKELFNFIKQIREEIKQRRKATMPNEEFHEIKLLDFSVRTYNCLMRANLVSLNAISNLTYEELSKIRHLNKNGVDEVILVLKENGLHLREENKEETENKEEESKEILVKRICDKQKTIADQEQTISELKQKGTKEQQKNEESK